MSHFRNKSLQAWITIEMGHFDSPQVGHFGNNKKLLVNLYFNFRSDPFPK